LICAGKERAVAAWTSWAFSTDTIGAGQFQVPVYHYIYYGIFFLLFVILEFVSIECKDNGGWVIPGATSCLFFSITYFL
jgi:hypothetical protein